jgi:hypothetical protein
MAPLDATALMSLERFEAAARLSIDGHRSEPFTVRTLPPGSDASPARAVQTVSASLKRYARSVELIDSELEAALGVSVEPAVLPPDTGLTPNL